MKKILAEKEIDFEGHALVKVTIYKDRLFYKSGLKERISASAKIIGRWKIEQLSPKTQEAKE